jgi:hypothetical protein
VYYESIKQEPRTRPIYECRWDERLKTKAEESTRGQPRLAYTGVLGKLEHLTIETRLIDEMFASVMGESTLCVLEVIGSPSMLRLTRKAAALARVLPTFAFSYEENAARRKWKTLSPRSCWTNHAYQNPLPDSRIRNPYAGLTLEMTRGGVG